MKRQATMLFRLPLCFLMPVVSSATLFSNRSRSCTSNDAPAEFASLTSRGTRKVCGILKVRSSICVTNTAYTRAYRNSFAYLLKGKSFFVSHIFKMTRDIQNDGICCIFLDLHEIPQTFQDFVNFTILLNFLASLRHFSKLREMKIFLHHVPLK